MYKSILSLPDHVDTARITRLIGSRGWALKLACLLASLPWQRAIRGLSVLFPNLLVSICSEAIEVSVSINSAGWQRAAGSSATTLRAPSNLLLAAYVHWTCRKHSSSSCYLCSSCLWSARQGLSRVRVNDLKAKSCVFSGLWM